jgi:hypothetical protein
MSAAVSEHGSSVAEAAMHLARQQRRYRWVAVGLIAAGLLLLAANTGMLGGWLARLLMAVWPALLVAAGIWLLRGGWNPVPATFALERADARSASLRLWAGNSDVLLASTSAPAILAEGSFPGDGPLLDVSQGHARLILEPFLVWPYAHGTWQTRLCARLPWSLDLRSLLGDMVLDLSALHIDGLRLGSTLGNVDLALPTTGQADMTINLLVGNLVIRVPDGVDVRVRVRAGRLAKVTCNTPRIVQVAPGEWVSPLFPTASRRCTLNVRLGTGDLTINQADSGQG